MSGYECMLCEGANGAAVWLTTSLESGKTGASCNACYPVALVGALAAELGVDGNKLYDTVKRFTDKEAKAAQAQLAKEDECPVCGAMVALAQWDAHMDAEHSDVVAAGDQS